MSSSQTPVEGNPPPKSFSMSLSSTSKPNGQSKKPTSFNLQSSTTDSPNRSLPRRPQNLHHDSDEDEDEAAPAHEAVTGFDTHTGTAISAEKKEEKKDLVIPVASGNNWRDRPGVNIRRGRKNLLPAEVQALQRARERGEDVGGQTDTEGPSVKYGLSFAEPGKGENGEEDDEDMKDAGPIIPPVVDEKKPLTQDEVAMRALIRESKGETEGRSDLVIPATRPDEEEEGYGERYDETSSFRADVSARPESATLDQYNAIPVEEFGAALLRGMGWKEGQPVGRGNYNTSATAERSHAPRVPERRPGFLGIGAKDLSGGKGAESEIGAWGKAAMRKGARKNGANEGDNNTEGVYMPVLMRNKQTGDYITEEELAIAKKESKSRKDDEWKERRDRNLERSGRDRDRDYRRRDYDDDDDYDRRRRTGSSRRDRSLSSSDRHSRRRRYDDNYDTSSGRDDRFSRDKDRDRDRERRRDRERDRDRRDRERSHRSRDDDRYSSRHSSSNTSRHRDRDRERDRDSDRDSHRRRRHDDR